VDADYLLVCVLGLLTTLLAYRLRRVLAGPEPPQRGDASWPAGITPVGVLARVFCSASVSASLGLLAAAALTSPLQRVLAVLVAVTGIFAWLVDQSTRALARCCGAGR